MIPNVPTAAPAVVHPDLQVLSPNHIMVSQSAANSLELLSIWCR